MSRGPIVMGLDLSLTCTGICIINSDGWDCEAKRAQCAPMTTEGTGIERIARLANRIGCIALRSHVTHVWIESYAYSQAARAHSLGELGGVVRYVLQRDCGLTAETAPMQTARKLLLGKVPRSDIKVHVQTFLRRAGLNFETADEADAFVVANYGMSELGLGCLVTRAA